MRGMNGGNLMKPWGVGGEWQDRHWGRCWWMGRMPWKFPFTKVNQNHVTLWWHHFHEGWAPRLHHVQRILSLSTLPRTRHFSTLQNERVGSDTNYVCFDLCLHSRSQALLQGSTGCRFSIWHAIPPSMYRRGIKLPFLLNLFIRYYDIIIRAVLAINV